MGVKEWGLKKKKLLCGSVNNSGSFFKVITRLVTNDLC